MENIANNLKSITQDIKVGVIRNEGMRNDEAMRQGRNKCHII